VTAWLTVTATSLLGLVASVVFIARLMPQPVRLARSGVADGVSPLAALNAVVVAVAWVVDGLIAGLPVVWVVSVVAMVPGAWAVVLLREHIRPTDLVCAGAWIAALLIALATGTFAGMLGVGVVVTQGPQVWRAVREDDLDGLSPATWWLSILDAVTWGAYGLAVGHAALVGYAAVLSASAVTVLVRIWWTRRSSAAVPAHANGYSASGATV
jgi:uncharacterized protein with PQ loop repeat